MHVGRWITALAAVVLLGAGAAGAEEVNLVKNPTFEARSAAGRPVGYELTGSADYQYLGNPRLDRTGHGVALRSAPGATGSVSQVVAIDPAQGRWFRFRFRGLPQDGFVLADDGLSMTVTFLGAGGKTRLDAKRKELYPLIKQARRDLSANGNLNTGGAAVWRDYDLVVYVPFPQVDRLQLTVAFAGGQRGAAAAQAEAQDRPTRRGRGGEGGRGGGGGAPAEAIDTSGASFLIRDFSLTRVATPAELTPERGPETRPVELAPKGRLVALGGRWFYAARDPDDAAPALFDHTNAERLLYRDGPEGRCEAPFTGNTSAWLRAGDKDLAGKLVLADRLVADNVTVRFDADSMIVHTHGLPNHPTGRFPEVGFGNPNYIQEQDATYYIPLNPKVNPDHVATATDNSNHALNMGPIGVAVNGVVFFNPFDAGSMDASNIMDRCCGHPNPDNLYHYHKYPICVNSPWSDEGKTHSPLIGWAFDGFPIYGPYESPDVMAKDETGASALNEFNIHQDADRGWHYHVTPGKFPYLIGGYWGEVDPRDIQRSHHPAGAGERRGPGRGAQGQNPPGMGPDDDGPPGNGPPGQGMQGNGPAGNGPPGGGPPPGSGPPPGGGPPPGRGPNGRRPPPPFN